jgi:trimeric autotransporter adhesin
VVTANDGTGAWETEESWTPLLSVEAIYNAGGPGDWTSVDLEVTRVAFDEASLATGKSKNKFAVGGAIENTYAATAAGLNDPAWELLVGTLFTLNAAEYGDALNQLSGAQHAQGLWSVTNSLDMFKRAEHQRMKYAVALPVAPVVLKDPVVFKDPMPIETPVVYGDQRGPVALWLNVQGAWGDVDGDKNAPGFDHDRYSVHGGVDYRVTPELTLGAALGYMSAELDFNDGSKFEYDGIQIGGYAKYDWENWYINAMGAFGFYDGKSRRDVAFGRVPDPFECGCLVDGIPDGGFASHNKGKFDADAWMLSGEFGHRFYWAEMSWWAPYLGLTYQEGQIDRFTETAVGSAHISALRIGGSGDSFVTDLGVRAGHSFVVGHDMTAQLELRAAWLHEFGDNPHSMKAIFAGVPDSDFKVVGSKISRDTFAFDAGMSFQVTHQLGLGFSYIGRFNADLTDHGLMGKAVFTF